MNKVYIAVRWQNEHRVRGLSLAVSSIQYKKTYHRIWDIPKFDDGFFSLFVQPY